LRELKEKQTPKERGVPSDWPGFESVFKVQVVKRAAGSN
jgi:hypothetical protein